MTHARNDNRGTRFVAFLKIEVVLMNVSIVLSESEMETVNFEEEK